MTFQRKLLLGFSLMVLPVLLVGAEAIRSNALERRALEVLGEGLARNRTYSQVENAMFDQTEVVWRYLSGLDPEARTEFHLTGEVVDFWLSRWRGELRPDEMELANSVEGIQRQIRLAADSIFRLYDAGRSREAYVAARVELKERLRPALAQINREVYRKARENSVQRAFLRVEEIVDDERWILVSILVLALAGGLFASWRISRSLARPIRELREAMAVVGAGDLDHPVVPRSRDEIGDLARAFAQMTERLRQSRADMVRLNAELAAKVAQLERAQAQLVQAERLATIGEMAAAVAHGLRNPLASLRASAQLVRRHPGSPASSEHLSAIIEEVDRLDRRIAHLLTFARPAPYHPMPERVPHLVEGLLPSIGGLLRERGIALETDLPAELPTVRVDPMQLEQALLELLSNALDAMPDGGRLRVAARAEPDATGRAGLVIEVADTGRGIPPHILPSVCEPFFTTRPEGTGLGLAVAKRYVEQNGGRLAIESEPGAGTTVRVWLPFEPAEDAVAAAAGAGRPA